MEDAAREDWWDTVRVVWAVSCGERQLFEWSLARGKNSRFGSGAALISVLSWWRGAIGMVTGMGMRMETYTINPPLNRPH